MRKATSQPHFMRWAAAAVILLAAILLLTVRVSTVTVTNSKRYTPEQLEEILFPGKWDRNFAYCYLKNRFSPHKQIPFVEDYQLVFHSPVNVEVIVYEKNIVGYVSDMSSYMYFDKDGIVVESSSDKLAGIPLITGLEFGQLILHQPLPVKDKSVFQDIMNLTQQLSLKELSVDRIEYNSRNEATLYMGELEVFLGNGQDVEGKISVLSDILRDNPQLLQMHGTIELDDYSETGVGGGITFKYK